MRASAHPGIRLAVLEWNLSRTYDWHAGLHAAGLHNAASLEQPDRITPVERSIEFRPDLTIDLKPYTVAVVEIAAR